MRPRHLRRRAISSGGSLGIGGSRSIWLTIGLSVLGAGGVASCHSNDPVYFPADMVLESDGMGTPVQATVPLKFRAPTATEQAQLDAMTNILGYPAPWLRQDRVRLEVKYTITNTGSDDGIFSLFVDGATEFTRFDYQAVAAAFDAVNEDPPPVGLIQPPNQPVLKPGQVYQGLVREDDFREASLDLDAMGRFMAPFVSVLINRSEVNPVGLDMVPTHLSPPQQWILPALWEVTVRFNANQPMTGQFMVRVRDADGLLWENGDNEFSPAPTTFTPALP
ncbi:MAG: hypothetical protein ABJA82_15175 [Myxococcales bacterium]